MPAPPTDEEWMRRAIAGDAKAFAAVYEKWAPIIFRFLASRGAPLETARDLTQDIFLKLAERPELFHPDKRFSSWIFTVALNRLRNLKRDTFSRSFTSDAALLRQHPSGHVPAADNQVDEKNFLAALDAALEQLEETHRDVFLLRYKAQLSLAEIADILAIPEGTVKSRLFYALRKLAEKLKDFKPE